MRLRQTHTVVAIGDIPASGEALDLLGLGLDIGVLVNGLCYALKRSVRLDLQTVGVINERIARYAGRFLIRLAEAAVNDKQLAAGFDRLSPLPALTGVCPFMICPFSGSRPNSVSIIRTARSSSQKLK